MRHLTGRSLSRRTILRGAGAALALPLLDAMIPAGMARAATRAAPATRMACIYIAHGAVQDRWTPAGDGFGFEFSPILQSLEPFRDRVNVISGLTLPAAYVGDPSAGGHHDRSSQCWLTCVSPGTGPSPTSTDQLVAEHIGQETPLPSLELSLDERGSISYRTPTAPMPMENNPRVVFERLFGDGSTPLQRAARQRQSASILDMLMGQVARLQRDLPAADRIRMERYLDDVREVERRLSLQADSLPEDVSLPARPAGIPEGFEQHARLMFDLKVLAWQADLTRVSTLLIARELSNQVYPESGISDGFHNCSHHMDNPANLSRLAQLNEYHTRTTLAYLLERLRDTPDGDGSLLDHSLVLYGSGMGDSQVHGHTGLPIILAGGASGKLQGGRHIRSGPGTPLANLHVSIFDKLEIPVESFADSTGRVIL